MFSLSGFIDSLLIIAIHESAVLISLRSSKLLLVIAIYHKHSELIMSQTEHTAVPISSSLIVVIYLFFCNSEWHHHPSKNLEVSLIISPPLIVLTQALIKYVLPILLHLAISSSAVCWTLCSALEIQSSFLHPCLCTVSSTWSLLSLESPSPSSPFSSRLSSAISPYKTSVTLPKLSTTLNSLLSVETYLIEPTMLCSSIFHLSNHTVNS